MPARALLPLLGKLDRGSWYFFIAWFATALLLRFISFEPAATMAYWGVVLVLINNFIRILLVAERFHQTGKPRYELLTYLLVGILLLSIGIQFLIR